MARTIAALLLLAVLTGFVCWLGRHIEDDAARMEACLEQTRKGVAHEDWESARRGAEALETAWDELLPLYRVTQDQRIIDQTDNIIHRLGASVDHEQTAEFHAEEASMRCLLESMKDFEKITWHSVL